MDSEGLKKLYLGDFNTMAVINNPDGTQTITLSKDGNPRAYRFRVKNLYQADEQLLEHAIIDAEQPKHIQQRIEEYQKDVKGQASSDQPTA